MDNVTVDGTIRVKADNMMVYLNGSAKEIVVSGKNSLISSAGVKVTDATGGLNTTKITLDKSKAPKGVTIDKYGVVSGSSDDDSVTLVNGKTIYVTTSGGENARIASAFGGSDYAKAGFGKLTVERVLVFAKDYAACTTLDGPFTVRECTDEVKITYEKLDGDQYLIKVANPEVLHDGMYKVMYGNAMGGSGPRGFFSAQELTTGVTAKLHFETGLRLYLNGSYLNDAGEIVRVYSYASGTVIE